MKIKINWIELSDCCNSRINYGIFMHCKTCGKICKGTHMVKLTDLSSKPSKPSKPSKLSKLSKPAKELTT